MEAIHVLATLSLPEGGEQRITAVSQQIRLTVTAAEKQRIFRLQPGQMSTSCIPAVSCPIGARRLT